MIAQTSEGDAFMDDSKLEELRLIHRDLAKYLKKQHEAVSNGLLTMAALRMTLDSDPVFRKSYKTNLRALLEDGTFQASPTSENTLQTLLKRLADW
jgi:hypothetical protein